MLNRVTLIGNLGKDPEMKRLEGGTLMGRFSLATNEYYRDNNNELQQQTEWHDVIVWRFLAEQAEKTLKKGALVLVEGKITYRKYTDKKGIERTVAEIAATSFKALDKKENGSRDANGNLQENDRQHSNGHFDNSDDNDMPF